MKKLLITLILLQFVIHPATAQRSRGFVNDYPKFMFGIQGGWSHRTAKISSDVPADFRDYVKKLKSGYHFGADAAYYFKEDVGVGIKYSFFHASNKIGIYAVDSVTKNMQTGIMSDNITIQYIGPSINRRFITDNRLFHFNIDASLGYLWYKDDAVAMTSYQLTSGTLGVAVGINAYYAITPSLFAGIEVSGTFGTLTYYNYKDGSDTKKIDLPDNAHESLSRIDISAGIRWNF